MCSLCSCGETCSSGWWRFFRLGVIHRNGHHGDTNCYKVTQRFSFLWRAEKIKRWLPLIQSFELRVLWPKSRTTPTESKLRRKNILVLSFTKVCRSDSRDCNEFVLGMARSETLDWYWFNVSVTNNPCRDGISHF